MESTARMEQSARENKHDNHFYQHAITCLQNICITRCVFLFKSCFLFFYLFFIFLSLMTITSGSTTQGASDNIFHKATLHLPYILTMPPISNGRHCMLLLHRYSELPYICRLVLKKRVTLKAERDGRGKKN